jgi:hypothetical protein
MGGEIDKDRMGESEKRRIGEFINLVNYVPEITHGFLP